MTTLNKTDTLKGLRKKTAQELLDNAAYWLNKAVEFEEEGKSNRMIDMCFNKALAFEDKAYLSPYEAAVSL